MRYTKLVFILYLAEDIIESQWLRGNIKFSGQLIPLFIYLVIYLPPHTWIYCYRLVQHQTNVCNVGYNSSWLERMEFSSLVLSCAALDGGVGIPWGWQSELNTTREEMRFTINTRNSAAISSHLQHKHRTRGERE